MFDASKTLKKLIKTLKDMTTITINQKSFQGRNIVINNGKVVIDGKDVTPDGKEINISVVGNIETINADACTKIEVKGDVRSVKTMSGDVEVTGNVTDSATSTSGDVEVGGSVGGNVKTMSGDVDCGDIKGDVSTMSGDIKHRKN